MIICSRTSVVACRFPEGCTPSQNRKHLDSQPPAIVGWPTGSASIMFECCPLFYREARECCCATSLLLSARANTCDSDRAQAARTAHYRLDVKCLRSRTGSMQIFRARPNHRVQLVHSGCSTRSGVPQAGLPAADKRKAKLCYQSYYDWARKLFSARTCVTALARWQIRMNAQSSVPNLAASTTTYSSTVQYLNCERTPALLSSHRLSKFMRTDPQCRFIPLLSRPV